MSRRVCVDDLKAAKAITEHLIKLGHKRIAHITGATSQFASEQRSLGYQKSPEYAGIPVDDNLIIEGDFTYQSGQLATNTLLS